MMKAKVKATGEIVNVYFRSPLWYNGDTEETYFPKELDTVWVEKRENSSKDPDYWTRLEHQYAGMAMQGILANTSLISMLFDATKDHDELLKEVIICSHEYAHALVEKYNKVVNFFHLHVGWDLMKRNAVLEKVYEPKDNPM